MKIDSLEFTKEQLEKIEKDDWYRAGGECVCSVCGEFYKKHQDIALDKEKFFYLTVLCNGDLVKL